MDRPLGAETLDVSPCLTVAGFRPVVIEFNHLHPHIIESFGHLGNTRVDLAPTAKIVMLLRSFSSLFSAHISCLLLLRFLLYAPLTSALWPLPALYEHGDSVVWLDRDLTFQYAITNQVGHLQAPLYHPPIFYVSERSLTGSIALVSSFIVFALQWNIEPTAQSQHSEQLRHRPSRHPTSSGTPSERCLHSVEVPPSTL